MVLKRKLPSRVQPEQPAPMAMPPAAPSSAAVSLPNDNAPVLATEPDLTFADSEPAPTFASAPEATTPQPASPPEPVYENSAPEPELQPEPTPQPDVSAAEPDLTPSLPTENGMKRKVRAKTARAFSTTLPEADTKAVDAVMQTLSAVPNQTDVDFDKVSDKLSSLGVKATATDTLVAAAAPMAAEMEAPPAATVAPPESPTPAAPKPADKTPAPPAWLAELTKELQALKPEDINKPKPDSDGKRERLGLPPPPTLPPNLLSGLVVDEPEPAKPAEATPALPAPLPPTPALPEPGLKSTSTSDVPWATTPKAANSEWSLDLPADGAALPPSPQQPQDIYAGVGKDMPAGTPPWQTAGAQPAELPSRIPPSALQQPAWGKIGITAGVLLLVVVGGWWLVASGDRTHERLARLTGSLRETTENLPAELGGREGAQGRVVQPEQTIATNLLPPPDEAPASRAVIDFADVPAAEARRKIVADGTEDIPEEVGFVASLQKAIADKKAERLETSPDGTAFQTTGNPALDKTIRNNTLKAQLDAELAAYRKALVEASSVAEAPRPGDFIGSTPQPAKPFMDGANTAAGLSPPPAQPSRDGLPPASVYGENPANLPILPEPTSTASRVRTLADFDATLFEPERERVRIPKGLKPRMSLSDFPEMDVLSLVPNKGLIAYRNGTEGVLLVGETVDGWQLVQVGPDSAEFRNGGRSYYVSAE